MIEITGSVMHFEDMKNISESEAMEPPRARNGPIRTRRRFSFEKRARTPQHRALKSNSQSQKRLLSGQLRCKAPIQRMEAVPQPESWQQRKRRAPAEAKCDSLRPRQWYEHLFSKRLLSN